MLKYLKKVDNNKKFVRKINNININISTYGKFA